MVPANRERERARGRRTALANRVQETESGRSSGFRVGRVVPRPAHDERDSAVAADNDEEGGKVAGVEIVNDGEKDDPADRAQGEAGEERRR
jgi:hypothetical protein